MALLKKPTLLFVLCSLLIVKTPSRAQNDRVLGADGPSDVVEGLKRKKTVAIINDLGRGLTLHYHCKSADDDLGDRMLGPRGSWSFRFEPNFIGTTQFYCTFWWTGRTHWFDIYKDSRDNSPRHNSCDECKWMIRPTGPCRFNGKTNRFDLCYGWNK